MKIIFRCDSSYNIGSGHLIRCLNLAKKFNAQTYFLCQNLLGNINSLVVENQFELLELTPSNENLEIEETINEIQEVQPVLKKIDPDLIIVDHYGIDKTWEELAKKYAHNLLIIDDLNRIHTNALILDQNFHKETPSNYIDSHSELFLGPQYCLLNQNFSNITPKKDSSVEVENILVFFGGSDLQSQTLRLAKLISNFSTEIHWDIVIGIQNKDKDELLKVIEKNPNAKLHIQIDYMSRLMEKADLFIGAGGTTTWERALCGLPSIVISTANNQIKINQDLHCAEIINYIGSYKEISDEVIITQTQELIVSQSRRDSLTKNSLSLNVGSKIDQLVKRLQV